MDNCVAYSSCGIPQLSVNGFDFSLNRTPTKSGDKIWKCINCECVSKLYTNGENEIVNLLKSVLSRTHESDVAVRKFLSRKRKIECTEGTALPRKVFRSTNSITSNTNDTLGAPKPNLWLDNINSPLIQEDGDNKMLKLRFDVSQYQPEEIIVKTVDNKLLVHAKHEEKSDSKSVYREYNREFLLPKGTNPESIKSSLSKDGVLTVEAPLPVLGAPEKLVPIAHH